MKIDSHHHFWHYRVDQYAWIDDAKASLRRDFQPADLTPLLAENGIDGVITVQARQSVDETRELLETAANHDWIRGVVGWVPLCDANVAQSLDPFAGDPKFLGVRHVVQDEPDARFLVRPDFVRGLKILQNYDLVYDLLILPHQLPAAIELVDQFPNQRFVLDHIAKPRIGGGVVDPVWKSLFLSLAARPHLLCKFSGIITEVTDPSWDIETMRPYWDIAIEAFGAERLMFGTDWPVCTLRGSYAQWTSVVGQLAGSLSDAEQTRFWGSTAIDGYRAATI